MNLLLDSVSAELALGEKNGKIRMVNKLYDPSSFGDAVINFISKNCFIRVLRDRGDTYIEIAASEDSKWHSLAKVIELALKTESVTDPVGVAKIFVDHFDEVEDLMSKNSFRAMLSESEEKESAAVLARLFPPRTDG